MSFHKHFRSSLIKFCQTQLDELMSEDIININSQYVDFDAHAQLTSLPEVDLLGTANLNWLVDEKTFDIDVMIGVSTFRDANMFRHHETIDFLADRLMPEKQIAVIDANLATTLGWMVITNGTQLLPIMKTETRSVQFLQVGLLTSLTYSASLE